ncbi:hypothetical protein GCM10007162_08150 [Ignatzschineria ureiclastica]|nr:hypothetical protein GCM10007162_08150 [Ignatzschineria ureiclastica]
MILKNRYYFHKINGHDLENSNSGTYSKFDLRKMFLNNYYGSYYEIEKEHQAALNNTCKMPDRTASSLITADVPAFK